MTTEPDDVAVLSLILRVFRVFDGFEGGAGEDLFWRTDGEYAPATIFVRCNDLFHWGTADLEPITPENIGVLEQACEDAKRIGFGYLTDVLFCCRSRGMRPQRPAMRHLPEAIWPLLDACGPERSE